jgi:hypothetical protein
MTFNRSEYEKERYKNPERRAKKKIYDEKYRSKKDVKKYRQQWYLDNKNKPEFKAKRQQWYLDNKNTLLKRYEEGRSITKHGITIEEYQQMLLNQNNRCAICKTNEPGGKGRWHIDHCHETNKVRGLLCTVCNTGLGMFKDDPERLQNAISYLMPFDYDKYTGNCEFL